MVLGTIIYYAAGSRTSQHFFHRMMQNRFTVKLIIKQFFSVIIFKRRKKSWDWDTVEDSEQDFFSEGGNTRSMHKLYNKNKGNITLSHL